MAIVLTLRGRETHGQVELVHPRSESVLLANVFGIVKNPPYEAVLNPWLDRVTRGAIPAADDWQLNFWESQPPPTGVREGRTEVDLEMDSALALVFMEVKLDADPSGGTTHDAQRDQLTRDLDVGHAQAAAAGKRFAVVYVTADADEPPIVGNIRRGGRASEANPGVEPATIAACLHWCPWASVGDIVLDALTGDALGETARWFALDLLAYLKKKGHWNRRLPDALLPIAQGNKLYRDLLPEGEFTPYARGAGRDQSWRENAWSEVRLRQLLRGLRDRDKALLKVIAVAGGTLRQGAILDRLPLLGGSSGSLSGLKRYISEACRGERKAPVLVSRGPTGNERIHEINPALGPLRAVVIEEAGRFEIPRGLIHEGGCGPGV